MLYVIHMVDRPGGEAVRAATNAAHIEFVGRHMDSMYLGGPMLADDGETIVGSMIVKDFEDRQAAEAFIAQEPYNQAGLFESVTIRAFKAVVKPS